ncbi:MAG: hypothetical protein OXC27_02720, partial [Caldilineaceae bacterium]|nr:hypothetical protein [Caldilineaceae bacterium]
MPRPVSSGLSVAHVASEEDDSYAGDFFEEEEQYFDESESPPFVLSEGQPGWDGSQTRPPLAETTPLTSQQVQELLTRLPPVQAEEGDVEQVRLPGQSLPPPRPGEEVDLPFPPPEAEAQP